LETASESSAIAKPLGIQRSQYRKGKTITATATAPTTTPDKARDFDEYDNSGMGV
jgi:hypothetical protein